MNLVQYRVNEIRYTHGTYILGYPVEIIDEGSFYRIDGTHIFDKFRIQSMKLEGNQLTIQMKDQDVILVVESKHR